LLWQIAYFHTYILPKGNNHFGSEQLPDNRNSNNKGRDSFKDICFEELFELMKTIFKTEEQLTGLIIYKGDI
jgi:hypothetical protein